MNNKPINISLGLNKQSYTIDGDESRVIYLDPSDMSVAKRLEDFSGTVEALFDKLRDIPDEEFTQRVLDVDKELREAINVVFDYDVCSVCVPSGTMFDGKDGKFKFEIVMNTLAAVYTDNISAEMKKITDRISKHTKKYTKKK